MILVLSLTIDDQPIEHDELRLLCWVTGSRKGIFSFFLRAGIGEILGRKYRRKKSRERERERRARTASSDIRDFSFF
jgi:hypothetical protein